LISVVRRDGKKRQTLVHQNGLGEHSHVAVRSILLDHVLDLLSNLFPKPHVRLILLDGADSPFYLEIPITVINPLFLKPRKYLVFLGWCILGFDGVLAVDEGGDEIDTDGDLDAGGTYYYVADIDEATGEFLKIPLLSRVNAKH
jgi:hypothetical protein